MVLYVHTDAEFAGNGDPHDNNAPPTDLDTETAALVGAAQEWVTWVQTFSQTAPKEGLTRLLRVSTVIAGDRTVSVMNNARALIQRAFPRTQHNRDAYSACEALYHLCLHRVLLRGLGELVETNDLATPMQLDPQDRDGAVTTVLDETEALAGLVQACAELVNLAFNTEDESDTFPATSQRMGRDRQWVELVQGLAWIRAATREPALAGAYVGEPDAEPLLQLPEDLDNYIDQIQEKCIEFYCFQTPSSYFNRVLAVHTAARVDPAAAWSTPNGRIINYITELTNNLAEDRAAALCYGLCKTDAANAAAQAIAEPLRDAACALATTVMERHLDIIFNRNLTLVSMAAVQTSAKWAGVRVKFAAVQRVAEGLFGLDDENLTFSLEMPESALNVMKEKERMKKGADANGTDGGEEEEEEEKEAKKGPAREFYNSLFVTIIELYRGEGEAEMAGLLRGKGPALKAAVAAAQAQHNGGKAIVLEYPPGTGTRTARSSRKITVEETPEPGLRKGGGRAVASSAGASNWIGGDAGPPPSPRGRASEPGVASARRPSAARPGGKRALLAVSSAGVLASQKKR